MNEMLVQMIMLLEWSWATG